MIWIISGGLVAFGLLWFFLTILAGHLFGERWDCNALETVGMVGWLFFLPGIGGLLYVVAVSFIQAVSG